MTSWKEIADYLRVAERTAQKWEIERGLPVRRLPGPKGRVSSDPTDLDRWKQVTLEKPAWRSRVGFLRVYAVVTTVLLLLLGGLQVRSYLARLRPGSPARFRLDVNALTVTDADGRELWTRTFPEPLLARRYTPELLTELATTWFGDVDHDGAIDTLFAYHPAGGRGAAAMFCFTNSGALKWQFVPGDRVLDGRPLSPVAVIQDFVVADLNQDGETKIVLAIHHPSLKATQVAVVDAGGTLRGEYWHPGRFDRVYVRDLNGDGAREILVAGASHRYGAAAIAVLDSRKVLETQPPRVIPSDHLAADPRLVGASVVFPRTCVNQTLEVTNRVTVGSRDDGPLRARQRDARAGRRRVRGAAWPPPRAAVDRPDRSRAVSRRDFGPARCSRRLSRVSWYEAAADDSRQHKGETSGVGHACLSFRE
ncbi:MAG: hypothetical protein HYS05_06255 [Acidobacteria bacterium]|nr:hypothetical protein [Acidobacteriota bacterium]